MEYECVPAARNDSWITTPWDKWLKLLRRIERIICKRNCLKRFIANM